MKNKIKQPKVALIVGSKGQDATYLKKFLKTKHYNIIEVFRGGAIDYNGVFYDSVSIENAKQIKSLVQKYKPHEIYYLAAIHQSSEDSRDHSYNHLMQSLSTHVVGFVNFLDAIETESPLTRIFYAASCHIFGNPSTVPQTENLPFKPICHYGITKATGVEICRFYRNQKRIFCSSGILYNHESPLRSTKFLSNKIVSIAVQIKLKLKKELVLGNLNSVVDWGYAKDFVRAMHAILNIAQPDDFVIATGKTYSVKQFAEITFNLLGLDTSKYLRENNGLLNGERDGIFCGDTSKIFCKTNWRPYYSLEKMIKEMILYEMKKYKNA